MTRLPLDLAYKTYLKHAFKMRTQLVSIKKLTVASAQEVQSRSHYSLPKFSASALQYARARITKTCVIQFRLRISFSTGSSSVCDEVANFEHFCVEFNHLHHTLVLSDLFCQALSISLIHFHGAGKFLYVLSFADKFVSSLALSDQNLNFGFSKGQERVLFHLIIISFHLMLLHSVQEFLVLLLDVFEGGLTGVKSVNTGSIIFKSELVCKLLFVHSFVGNHG